MKFQYFLRGLGVGLVLSAIVLCVTYRVSGNTGVNVVEEAKKLGMVFPEGTQAPENTPESILNPTPEPDEAGESGEPESSPAASGAGVTGKETNESEDKKTEKTKKKAKATAKPKKNTKSDSDKSGAKFTVKSGQVSSSVAREMKEAGIIEDAADFDRFLQETGYSRKIRSGTYTIPSGSSYSQIAKIITKQ